MSDPPRNSFPRRWLPLFPPVARPFFALLGLLLAVTIVVVELELVETAYARIGVGSGHVFSLLLLSLVGSWVNVPVAVLEAEVERIEQEVRIFGVRYVIPVVEETGRTVVAVNVGGALIPTLVSLWLLAAAGVPLLRSLLASVVVSAIVHAFARPVRGVGVVVPLVIPPIAAAGTALLLGGAAAAPVAYVAGTLGTLVGADLLTLGRIRRLGAPVVSIGGAGTFDGIFVTGVLAALLA
jgi:uncharacterized membrane protein